MVGNQPLGIGCAPRGGEGVLAAAPLQPATVTAAGGDSERIRAAEVSMRPRPSYRNGVTESTLGSAATGMGGGHAVPNEADRHVWHGEAVGSAKDAAIVPGTPLPSLRSPARTTPGGALGAAAGPAPDGELAVGNQPATSTCAPRLGDGVLAGAPLDAVAATGDKERNRPVDVW